jgi:hypothetical protein
MNININNLRKELIQEYNFVVKAVNTLDVIAARNHLFVMHDVIVALLWCHDKQQPNTFECLSYLCNCLSLPRQKDDD